MKIAIWRTNRLRLGTESSATSAQSSPTQPPGGAARLASPIRRHRDRERGHLPGEALGRHWASACPIAVSSDKWLSTCPTETIASASGIAAPGKLTSAICAPGAYLQARSSRAGESSVATRLWPASSRHQVKSPLPQQIHDDAASLAYRRQQTEDAGGAQLQVKAEGEMMDAPERAGRRSSSRDGPGRYARPAPASSSVLDLLAVEASVERQRGRHDRQHDSHRLSGPV